MSINECARNVGGIQKDDLNEIKAITTEYLEDGKPRKDASVLAAKEFLNLLYKERTSLGQEVRELGGVLPGRLEAAPEAAGAPLANSEYEPEPQFSFFLIQAMSEFEGLKKKVGDISERVRPFLQDTLIDLHKLEQDRTLGNISSEFSGYMHSSLFADRAGKQARDYREHRLVPLKRLIAGTGLTPEEVSVWLVARTAEESNLYLKEINPDTPNNDALIGMTNEEAASIMRVRAGVKNLKEIGLLVDQMSNEHLDRMVASGLISQDDANRMRGRYEHYVPVNREDVVDAIISPSGAISVRSSGLKNRLGSPMEPDFKNLLAHFVSQHYAAMFQGEKDITMHAVYRFVVYMNDPDIATVDDEQTMSILANALVPELDANGNYVYLPQTQTLPGMPPGTPKLSMVRGQKVVVVPATFKHLKMPNVTPLRINGETHWITWNQANPAAMRIASALNNLDGFKAHPIVRAWQAGMRYLSSVYTSWSFSFPFGNMVMDIQTGLFNATATQIKNQKAKLMMGVVPAIAGLRRNLRTGDKTSVYGAYAERYRAAGGSISWADAITDAESMTKILEKEINRFVNTGKMESKVSRTLGWIEDYNTIVEGGIRLSAFKTAVESGLDDTEAAFLAKNITVNFRRHGTVGPYIQLMWVFANVGFQGTATLAKTIATSRMARAAVGGIIALSAMREILNAALSDDDDDGKNLYLNLPDHEKDRYFIIWNGKEPVFKFPLGRGINFIDVIGQVIGRTMTDPDYSAKDGALRIANAAAMAFNPISSATMLQTISPTMVDPLVQIAENVTWTGKMLAPDQNQYGVPVPNYRLHFKSAREFSKWLTKALNDIDGNSVDPGSINLSPEWVDLVIDTVGGTLFRDISDVIDLGAKLALDEEIKAQDVPIVRKFFGTRTEMGLQDRFYANVMVVRIADELIKSKVPEERAIGLASPIKPMIDYAKDVAEEIKDIRRDIKDERTEEDPSKEEIERLEGIIRREMSRFNREFYKRAAEGSASKDPETVDYPEMLEGLDASKIKIRKVE